MRPLSVREFLSALSFRAAYDLLEQAPRVGRIRLEWSLLLMRLSRLLAEVPEHRLGCASYICQTRREFGRARPDGPLIDEGLRFYHERRHHTWELDDQRILGGIIVLWETHNIAEDQIPAEMLGLVASFFGTASNDLSAIADEVRRQIKERNTTFNEIRQRISMGEVSFALKTLESAQRRAEGKWLDQSLVWMASEVTRRYGPDQQ